MFLDKNTLNMYEKLLMFKFCRFRYMYMLYCESDENISNMHRYNRTQYV